MNSNNYPNFKKIEIEDKKVFDLFCHKFPSYSDFNLLSLLSWNTDNTNQYSLLNNNLVLKMKDYLGDGFIYSILGENLIDASLVTLFESTSVLKLVPEIVVEKISQNDKFIIEPDRDNDDYIISLEKMSTQNGSGYSHMRSDIRNFESKYPDFKTIQFSVNDVNRVNEVFDVTSKWCKDKKFSDIEYDDELGRLHRLFDNAKMFDCVYLGLFVGGKMISYMVSEIISEQEIISHFGVSDKDYESSTPMMEYINSKYFFDRGFKYQNVEQDTGLPGLRSSKMFYDPEYFLKKYTITLKEP